VVGFDAHPRIHRETAVFVPQHLFCLEVLQQPTAHKGAQRKRFSDEVSAFLLDSPPSGSH
ncbi:hypothetical protein, partial [Acidovorax temperans]|uniref:hypothetical protein n=1 Tax=Acidovorax temperans TaxID=80878 RepID=UPI001427CBC6